MTQALIASKSRLSKRELTVPGLEIIATHMAANLASNIKVLEGNKILDMIIIELTDSTDAFTG